MITVSVQAAMLDHSTCERGASHQGCARAWPQALALPQHLPDPGLPGGPLQGAAAPPSPFLPFWEVLRQTSPWPSELRYLLGAAFLAAESQTSLALPEPNNWMYVSKGTIKAWAVWLLSLHTQHLMKVISCECQSPACQRKQREPSLERGGDTDRY